MPVMKKKKGLMNQAWEKRKETVFKRAGQESKLRCGAFHLGPIRVLMSAPNGRQAKATNALWDHVKSQPLGPGSMRAFMASQWVGNNGGHIRQTQRSWGPVDEGGGSRFGLIPLQTVASLSSSGYSSYAMSVHHWFCLLVNNQMVEFLSVTFYLHC